MGVKCPRVCQPGDHQEMPQCCPVPVPVSPSYVSSGSQPCLPGSSAPGCSRTVTPRPPPFIVNPPGPVTGFSTSEKPTTCPAALVHKIGRLCLRCFAPQQAERTHIRCLGLQVVAELHNFVTQDQLVYKMSFQFASVLLRRFNL